MILLPERERRKLPPLRSTEHIKDPIAWTKFFTPDSSWSWFAVEFDGEDVFFGLVFGHVPELGYWTLSELESVRGPLGLPIERDLWWVPTRLSEVRRMNG
jgi:hypothetical protein